MNYDLLVLSDVDSCRSAAVESVTESDDLLLSCVERGKLQCILVSLCAGVDEEELIVVIAAGFAELLCQLNLQRVLNCIAIECELSSLLLHGLQILRVAMTDADNCMTAIEV